MLTPQVRDVAVVVWAATVADAWFTLQNLCWHSFVDGFGCFVRQISHLM
jgi:hypothetical protein